MTNGCAATFTFGVDTNTKPGRRPAEEPAGCGSVPADRDQQVDDLPYCSTAR